MNEFHDLSMVASLRSLLLCSYGFSGSCILGTQSVGSVSWDLRHPSHETFRRLNRASRGATEGGGKTRWPGRHLGKLRQRAEWWDFADERMSGGVRQLALFHARFLLLLPRDVDLVKKSNVG